MKRFISVLLCAVLLISLVSCNKNNDETKEEKGEEITEEDYLISIDYEMKSEHYTISAEMMNYYAHSSYYSLTGDSNYSSYLSYMGLDTSKPLDEQNYADNITWEQFFIDQANTQVENILVLCEEAKATGVTLSKEEKAKIDEEISNYEHTAKDSDLSTKSYLKSKFGCSDLKKVRKCIEYNLLANKMAEKIATQYPDPEEYNAMLEELYEKYPVTDTSGKADVDLDVAPDTTSAS